MSMPSRTAWGSDSMSDLFMNAPGSPSSALQIRYFRIPGALRQKVHFLNVGKPAPPRPLRPACLTVPMTSSGVIWRTFMKPR